MSITEYRERYKPFEYDWAWEKYKAGVMSMWTPEEVSMSSDVIDWSQESADNKRLIGGILRAFTLIECHVSCYWSDRVCQLFPKHEICAMARLFSSQEIIHSWAYAHLSDTLGLDEWSEYQGDPVAQAKVAGIINSPKDPIVSLGVFSGGVEGVSLMASFVVLLSFTQQGGKYKGLNQILSWSNIDENNHAEAGCRLFRELDEEGKVSGDQKQKIIDGFDTIIKNEKAFLENAYQSHPNPPIPLKDVIEYIKYRANSMLKLLNINYQYNYDSKLVAPIVELFESLMNGNVSVDFFAYAKNGAGYVAKPNQFKSDEVDWDNINLTLSNSNNILFGCG